MPASSKVLFELGQAGFDRGGGDAVALDLLHRDHQLLLNGLFFGCLCGFLLRNNPQLSVGLITGGSTSSAAGMSVSVGAAVGSSVGSVDATADAWCSHDLTRGCRNGCAPLPRLFGELTVGRSGIQLFYRAERGDRQYRAGTQSVDVVVYKGLGVRTQKRHRHLLGRDAARLEFLRDGPQRLAALHRAIGRTD
jgi:hypothetical protein